MATAINPIMPIFPAHFGPDGRTPWQVQAEEMRAESENYQALMGACAILHKVNPKHRDPIIVELVKIMEKRAAEIMRKSRGMCRGST